MGAHYTIRLVSNVVSNAKNTIREIQDTAGIVDDNLFVAKAENGSLLQYIDPYGDTIFNGLQAEALISEISNIPINNPKNQKFVSDLVDILQMAVDGVHLSVVFIGD